MSPFEVFDEHGVVRTLASVEAEFIQIALLYSPNVSEAARRLDIGRSTLYRKIAEYGLTTISVGSACP